MDFDDQENAVYSSVGGEDRCNVSLGVKITDNLPWRGIHTAIFAKNNPGHIIGLNDVQEP